MQGDLAQDTHVQQHAATAVPRRSLVRHLSEVQLLLDQAPSFLALTQGPAHTLAIANEAYLRLVGRAREDVVGRPILDAIPELREQGLELLLNDVLQTEQQRVGSAVRVDIRDPSDGSVNERRVDFLLQPIFDATNATVGIVLQGLDVTDRELAIEALQQADRRKDNFLAALAHEMLNPLSASGVALQAMTKLIERTEDRAAIVRLLGILHRQHASLAALVADLLDVSRIKLGKLPIFLEDVIVQEVVRSACETCQHIVEARSHALRVSMPEPELRVRADRRRLCQVMNNLLVNAAKYTPPGGEISVETRLAFDDVEVVVTDNGRGMTAGEAEHAFELHHQNAASDTLTGGLGIGLALVRQLMELQGGSVRAESPGLSAGTSVSIRLPLLAQRE